MSRCRPVSELLEDNGTPESLRHRLLLAEELLAFASEQLQLDPNGSYNEYADLQRPYVVWNVVAAPALSLSPKTWCFPFAGCVPYRGYFKEERAREYANRLVSQDMDVDVYGVKAYSTLGWFDDPLLNTFLFDDRSQLAETLFHELAHQRVYVKDHTEFNEAFAVVLARAGTAMWLEQQGDAEELKRWEVQHARTEEFLKLFDVTRDALQRTYAGPEDASAKLAMKESIFRDFRGAYAHLLASWGVQGRGGWLDRDLNNARFASAMTYRELVPAFERLWVSSLNEPERFYQAVEGLARLPKDERSARLHAEVTVPK